MPKNRVNERKGNLAKVSADKAEDDIFATSGIFCHFSYHDKKTRIEHKVTVDQNSRWCYEDGNRAVANGKYMYAIGKKGALYLGNVTVHSQFKAGKPVQSAGWLQYDYDPHMNRIVIDNCSGHYTPTLSQFMSTLYGLHSVNILPENFQLKLSKFTKIDYDTNQLFWERVIEDSNNDHQETEFLSVEFNKEIDGFVFHRGNGELLQMTKTELLINDNKDDRAPTSPANP